MSTAVTSIPQWQPVNSVFEDVAFLCTPPENNAFPTFLADCGELHNLSVKQINRISWVFLSHFHIDHVIGLDHLIRIQLGHDKHLHIAGPPGTTDHIYHRLQGYLWNLVQDSPFFIHTYDLYADRIESFTLPCHTRFNPLPPKILSTLPFQGLDICWIPAEHKGACLAYQWKYTPKPKVHKEALATIPERAWLGDLIRCFPALPQGPAPAPFQSWKEAQSKLLYEQPTSTLTYVTDSRLDSTTRERILASFTTTDTLICEAAFLPSEHHKAQEHAHATAAEVGHLAHELQAQTTALVHLSLRYPDPSEHLRIFQDCAGNHTGLIPDPTKTYPWR